jgi:hypothetical protein
MICELISFSAVELNTAVDVIKSITAISIAKNDAEALLKAYRPVEIRFSNVSGVAVNVDIFTADEYIAYLATPTLSDKTTIANDGTLTLTPKGNITKIVALGSAAHAGNLNITIVKE